MKQTKSTLFNVHACWRIGKILGTIAIFLSAFFVQAATVSGSITLDGIMLSWTYENVVCLGTLNTITYTLENTNTTPFADRISVVGFTPDATQPLSSGLTFVSDVPPQPSAVLFFDPTAPFPCPSFLLVCQPNTHNCPSTAAAAQGIGVWDAADGTHPLSNGIPYQFSITYQATACGPQHFFGELWDGIVGGFPQCPNHCMCFDTISILVIPFATLANETINTGICNNNMSGITGTLPAPLCPSGGCTGPLIPCATACSGPCTGATPFPFQFTVSDITGGTVTLLDPTAGVFQFVPDSSFMGTAQFAYNVISETVPPQFCSPTAATVSISGVVQIPITTPATFSGCGNSTITGNLADFTTGGSNMFTFTGGPATCGSVTVPPNGMFTFTAPSGAASCNFSFFVTDSVFGCTGSGTVTVNVTQPPTGNDASFTTCVNQPVSGTLTVTGGTPPFTFTISTPPVNGMITSFDPMTGDFTYTPNNGFTGSDTFQFTVTDSAMPPCMSLPATITIVVNPQPITSSTSIVGCQATPVTGSLTGLVTGGTGTQIFSISGSNVQTCGVLQIFADGSFTFTPNNMFTGSCNFEFQVTQGGCPSTGPDTIMFTILPAPVATGAIFNVCQFGNVTGDLNTLVISTTGNTSFTAVGPPLNGDLTLNPSGPFSFTATIASGTAGFKFEAISDVLTCPSAVEMVTVIVHPNPKVTTGTKAVCSDTATSGSLVPLVMGSPPFMFTGPFTSVNGTTTITKNGLFTFTPAPAAVTGSFTFGVMDVFGCTATGTELITVNPSPTASNQLTTGCSNAKITGSVAGDVSGGTPGFIFSLVPPVVGGMALVSSNGDFSFMPNGSATTGSFGFKATDTKGCMAFGTVTVDINPAPIAMTGFFTGCDNGFTGSLVPLVTGVNPPFTFTGPIGPVVNGSVTIDSAGDFFFNPSGLGSASFNFKVTDSAVPPCMSNVAPVNITIEQGPVASPATFDACENVPLMVTAASGLANFVMGGLPPYMFFQTGPTPACAASLTVNMDGSFDFTPALNFSGPCSFNWQVKDSVPCLSNISTATINVHPTPVANNSGPFPACEFDAFTGNLNDFMSVGTPPFTGFTGGNPINGMIDFLLPTGPFSFTPASVGLASFDFSAIDAFGCHSNTGTLTFNAAESPVITSPSPLDVCSNESVTSIATATGSPAIQPFTFTITGVVNGTAMIVATTPTSATFTFTPNVTVFPTPIVQGSVTIRATAAAPSVCFSETTVIINIHQAPVINITGIGSCTGTFTGSLAQFVTGSMPPFIFGPVGIVPTNPPGCGTVILDIFGNFEFIANPPGSFPCPCSFDFTVTDSSMSTCTSTGTATICVSQPPIASNVTLCQCVGVPISIILSGFVSGGKPPFTFMIVGVPVGGQVILLNPTTGLVVFVPNPGFSGFASFQFKVTDSNVPPCMSNIGTVTIQIPCCPPTGITPMTM
jgi:large repetitive protein